MSQPLSGKIALVTGGSRGIGAAIVRRLSTDGADVAFTYSASGDKAKAIVAEIEAKGANALAIKADSADPKAVQDAVDETVSTFGGIDILVNSAGILMLNPVENFPLEDFDRMFAVNVRAVFAGTQVAACGCDPVSRSRNFRESAHSGHGRQARTGGRAGNLHETFTRDVHARGRDGWVGGDRHGLR